AAPSIGPHRRCPMTTRQIVFATILLAIELTSAGSLADPAATGDRLPYRGSELPQVLIGNTLISQDQAGLLWSYYPKPGPPCGRPSGGDVDIGRWWIENDCYCRAWRRWFQGQTKCWQLAAVGTDGLMWLSLDGKEVGVSVVERGSTIGEMPARD